MEDTGHEVQRIRVQSAGYRVRAEVCVCGLFFTFSLETIKNFIELSPYRRMLFLPFPAGSSVVDATLSRYRPRAVKGHSVVCV